MVHNRRFLLLGEQGEHPNLASRILDAAIRDLPRLWWESFGYEPLLTETLTDMEVYEGTLFGSCSTKMRMRIESQTKNG